MALATDGKEDGDVERESTRLKPTDVETQWTEGRKQAAKRALLDFGSDDTNREEI
jgi:hypothetical protein